MISEIGFGAGDIWNHLDKHGPTKFSRLRKDIDCPRDLLLMSLGWLAREGHVILKQEGKGIAKDYLISLRQK